MQPVPIAILPMQWTVLPDLQQTPDLDHTDAACMAEIRDVLERHGKLSRFALHLAHRHFELAPGEVLIESPDPDGRTQHVTVGRLEDAPQARPTTWMLGPDLFAGGVYCVCVTSTYSGTSCSRHGKSDTPSPEHLKREGERDQAVAEDKARFENSGIVAGHDFKRERARKIEPDPT